MYNCFSNVFALYLSLTLVLGTASTVKAEKTNQVNYTKIINDGDGELKVAIVYFDEDKGELIQKGWYTIEPNSEEEVPFDVYYIYAYEADLYGEYIRMTGKDHFNIPEDDFESLAEKCSADEGYGFEQWFSGKDIPAKTPPKDEIKVSYNPEKTKQNYTRIINDGNSELRLAIIYYDYKYKVEMQKGWYTIAQNSEVEVPYDVYYIYAYESDLYGDYIRMTGKNHFEIPEDDFKEIASICTMTEGYGFEQWFDGKDVPAKTPPKDVIQISYKPEEFMQNCTLVSNHGGGELNVAIIYYDWTQRNLYHKSWIRIKPEGCPELPYDVFCIYAYEEDDDGEWHTVIGGKKYYFRASEEDYEGLAQVCKEDDASAIGFKMTCKSSSELIKEAQIVNMLPDASELFARLSNKTIVEIPEDIIVIENKTELEEARLK